MRIGRKRIVFLAAAALVPAVFLVAFTPQESEPTPQESQGSEKAPSGMGGMEGMEGMVPAASPLHGMFDDLLGRWEAHIKMWMEPGAPPSEFQGTSALAFAIGDQYLQETSHSEFMGMPFEGLGTWGFDAHEGRYWHLWLDSFGWPPIRSHGAWDAKTSTFTFVSEPYWDMWQQKNVTMRSVIHLESMDRWTFESYETSEGRKERKTMEILYTRPMG